jgi:hypothetical protein
VGIFGENYWKQWLQELKAGKFPEASNQQAQSGSSKDDAVLAPRQSSPASLQTHNYVIGRSQLASEQIAKAS